MFTIYLDNIRGFSKQTIPIMGVNFLVGENSTGKTSLISLLSIISSPDFILNPGFNNHDIKMGSYNEIVNQGSKKKTFSIGYHYKLNDEHEFKFVTFKNNDGTPSVSKISFIKNEKLFTCIVNSKKFEYLIHDIEINKIDDDKLYEIIRIEHDNISERAEYKTIEISGVPSALQVLHHKEIISADLEGEFFYKSKTSFSFSISHDLPEPVWISPIRAKPLRTYESYRERDQSDGSHVPQLLNTIISKSKKSGSNLKIIDAINTFGKNSGLFDNIDTKIYGEDLTSPFELDIIKDNMNSKICNVGYGVSQILPIITELLTQNRQKTLIIQQPEVHLHPKAQAALGTFLFEHAKNKSIYMIETHSDYLIDRFRLCLNKSEKTKNTAQVLFFEKKNGQNVVHAIKIDEEGRYDTEQPDAFREFFINEEIDLLRI